MTSSPEPRDGPSRQEQPVVHDHVAAEYRIACLQQRLAAGPTAEIAVRIESRGAVVTVSAVVPDQSCRTELLAAVAQELAGLEVRTDITVVDSSAPDHAEPIT